MPIRATAQRNLVQQYDISKWIRTLNLSDAIAEHNVTGMNETAEAFVPGFPDASGEVTGLLDHAVEASGPVLKAILGVADRIWSVAYEGLAVGKDVDLVLGSLTGFRPAWSVDGAAALAGSLVANGTTEGGRSLQDATALGAGNGAWVDWGAQSTSGAVLHLHALAVTGAPSAVDLTLEDSADGVVGAAVAGGAFASFTGPTAERLVVPGTIRRYTRIVRAFTGGTAPTVTAAVALARR